MTRETNIPLTRSYWPADSARPLLDMTAGDALRRAASIEPGRIALVEAVPAGMASLAGAAATDRRWTYAELLGAAEECAHWLLTRFSPGESVCLWAPNVPEWVILQYGAALAGLVLVTANPALREPELRYVLRQSKAAGLIHASEFRGTDMAAIARSLAPEVRERFCIADWRSAVPGHSRGGSLPTVSPTDPAQLQYTSGTTGKPKGALLHHRGLVTNASFVAARAGLERGVIVSPMPLFHTAGSAMSVLGCATTCSTLVLPLVFDAGLALAAIERERAGFFYGVPTMLIALMQQQAKSRHDLSSLRVALSGGAPVPVELLRRVEAELGCDLLTVYGQTELSPIVCQTCADDSAQDKAHSAGRPLWQVEVRIFDPVEGEIVAPGVEGEIQARGYQAMLGYFDMPKANVEAIDGEGWVRTGDLGKMDARGYVQVTGRLKDMIIRGGENIYPSEVEARLLEHPEVIDAAVFGVPDSQWGEVVAAAVRLRGGPSPSADELQAHCRTALAFQKTPAHWFRCEEFPLTGSGKVQKFRLRDAMREGRLEAIN